MHDDAPVHFSRLQCVTISMLHIPGDGLDETDLKEGRFELGTFRSVRKAIVFAGCLVLVYIDITPPQTYFVRSLNLNPLDFYFWGYLKLLVCGYSGESHVTDRRRFS
ncbi:hypothetical protein TNCV_4106181 [Trichonephila clavipes]|nr:hypothetical protein TNCV_4106181 [Trichonephila clavipes]